MKIHNGLIQGSPEWLEFRKSHLGASDAGTIMGLNPWSTSLQLWQEKCLGWTKDVNDAMRRGTNMEEKARDAYSIQTGRLVSPAVGTCEVHAFISASFDGISSDYAHAVEIKCGKASHKQAQKGIIPDYYYAQCQQQMYVAGLQLMDYWSFDGKEGILISVVRDNQFITKLVDNLIEFWNRVQSNTPPRG